MLNGIRKLFGNSLATDASGVPLRKPVTGKVLGGIAVLGAVGLVALAAERAQSPASEPPAAVAAAGAVPGEEVRGPGSYAFGFSLGAQIGGNIRGQNIDIDMEQFMEGFRTALTGAQPRMTEEQMQKAVEDLQRRQEALAAAAETRRQQENTKFLAENGKKPDIETTSSGLQYQVLKSGDGTKAGASSLVVVHYEGRLLDGTVFDSSISRGQPAAMRVDGVIPGWQEALQAMREGDKWRLWIPSELGYGAQGAGRMIPPHSVLVFEVELIEVKDENTPDGPARPPAE